MTTPLQQIVAHLADITDGFQLGAGSAQATTSLPLDTLENRLCRAWFVAQLETSPHQQQAKSLLQRHADHPVCRFIHACQAPLLTENETLKELVANADLLGQASNSDYSPLWQIFCPEAAESMQTPERVKSVISHARQLSKLTPTARPQNQTSGGITDVGSQLLLTSNVLLTIPLPDQDCARLVADESFIQSLQRAQKEPQQYWYDHPIPIGIPAAENEILYGLEQLDKSLAYEVERGNLASGQRITIALSCSVTHPSLASIAKQYVEYEIAQHLSLQHLQVVVFAESACGAIIDSVFPQASSHLKEVFGVNGAYGRHYSFLKAIAALWQKFIQPELKATFKIDLDQVFDQPRLIAQTGLSAFEHLMTPNWGADAIDSDGHPVHLGMIAGGLVNQADVANGLFTADVNPPNGSDYQHFERLFCPRWPQALSTLTEVIGQSKTSQRVHVTGGTNGILIEALYKYRPYTPTFINRAEDQAYILSAFARPIDNGYLGYYHQAGLIMRHDKEAFAAQAVRIAESGKALGDIERVLLFSYYAQQHPMGPIGLKQQLYPFTGSFISHTPVTLALLRFMLEGTQRDTDYIQMGAKRLLDCLNFCQHQMQASLESNQQGWQEYYDTLLDSSANNRAATQLLRRCILTL